ncbi:MAG TPA: hypothetical protein VNJ10_10665 [Sphingomonas sp.]|nr:hypothetical protein [Sphingomonas sp.]
MANELESARTAENLILVRDTRSELFPSEIFDEHAWNMLLRLYVAQAKDEPVSEPELIALTKTPPSVGKRWLAHLVADAQIEPYAEGGALALTGAALERMETFLRQASRAHESDGPA